MTTTRPSAEELCEAIFAMFDGYVAGSPQAIQLIKLAEQFRATPAANLVTIELPDPPKGYDYKRDASGRVCVEKPNGRPWLDIYGCVSHGTPSEGLMFVDGSRPILVKQQERVLMDFKAASEANRRRETVKCESRPDFSWNPNHLVPGCVTDGTFDHGLRAWMFDDKTFYIADPAGGTA